VSSAPSRGGIFSCMGAGSKPSLSDGDDDSESMSEASESTWDNFTNSTAAPIMAMKYPLAGVLGNDDARRFFKSFAAREMASDSVLCWEALADFRFASDDADKRIEIFNTLLSTFLQTGSSHQVAAFTFAQLQHTFELAATLQEAIAASDHEKVKQQLSIIADWIVRLQLELEFTDLNDLYIRFIKTKDFTQMIAAADLTPVDLIGVDFN
jgi:hypothetical protein